MKAIPAAVQKAFKLAVVTRKNSHSPYSEFKVGAGIVTSSGEIFGGCNVENASYGLTLCAETVAVARAFGERARGEGEADGGGRDAEVLDDALDRHVERVERHLDLAQHDDGEREPRRLRLGRGDRGGVHQGNLTQSAATLTRLIRVVLR